jgi:hypothetical protein
VTVLGFQMVWEENHWLVIGCGVGVIIIITALVLYLSPRRRRALVRCLRCGWGDKAHAKVTGDHDQALDSSIVNPLSPTAQTEEEPALMPSPALTLPAGRFKSPVPPAPTGEEPTATTVARESRTAPAEPAGKQP